MKSNKGEAVSEVNITFQKIVMVATPESPDACSFCSDVFNGFHGLVIKVTGMKRRCWVPICGECVVKVKGGSA